MQVVGEREVVKVLSVGDPQLRLVLVPAPFQRRLDVCPTGDRVAGVEERHRPRGAPESKHEDRHRTDEDHLGEVHSGRRGPPPGPSRQWMPRRHGRRSLVLWWCGVERRLGVERGHERAPCTDRSIPLIVAWIPAGNDVTGRRSRCGHTRDRRRRSRGWYRAFGDAASTTRGGFLKMRRHSPSRAPTVVARCDAQIFTVGEPSWSPGPLEHWSSRSTTGRRRRTRRGSRAGCRGRHRRTPAER